MKLKPCPLCQNETFGVEHKSVFIELTLEMGDLVAIHCYNCLASITRPTKEKAIEAWNTRPLEDQLKTHAVEVLAGMLAEADSLSYGYSDKEEAYFPEARALLGWEE